MRDFSLKIEILDLKKAVCLDGVAHENIRVYYVYDGSM